MIAERRRGGDGRSKEMGRWADWAQGPGAWPGSGLVGCFASLWQMEQNYGKGGGGRGKIPCCMAHALMRVWLVGSHTRVLLAARAAPLDHCSA